LNSAILTVPSRAPAPRDARLCRGQCKHLLEHRFAWLRRIEDLDLSAYPDSPPRHKCRYILRALAPVDAYPKSSFHAFPQSPRPPVTETPVKEPHGRPLLESILSAFPPRVLLCAPAATPGDKPVRSGVALFSNWSQPGLDDGPARVLGTMVAFAEMVRKRTPHGCNLFAEACTLPRLQMLARARMCFENCQVPGRKQ
jgi:hypothetical protein